MKLIKPVVAIAAILSIIGFAPIAFSQRPDRGEVRRLVDRIRENTEHFRHSLDSSLDRSVLDGSRTEDRINEFVQEFQRATDQLKERYGDDRSVQEVLDRAAVIDRFMVRHAVTGAASEDWMRLRANLDELAAMYGIARLGAVSEPISQPTVGPEAAAIPRRVNDREVKAVIGRIESEADRFRHSLHDALNHSHVKRSVDTDDIDRFVKNFESATDRLKHHFDSHNTAAADAEEVMRRAAEIDGFMRSHALNGRAQEDWRALRRDLDTLAAAYGVSWRWEQ